MPDTSKIPQVQNPLNSEDSLVTLCSVAEEPQRVARRVRGPQAALSDVSDEERSTYSNTYCANPELRNVCFDMMELYVPQPLSMVRDLVELCQWMVESGNEFIEAHAVNYYGYTISPPDVPGLRILVPRMSYIESGTNMGLYVIGGSEFCHSFEAGQYESIVSACLAEYLGLTVSEYIVNRVDYCVDVTGLQPVFDVATRIGEDGRAKLEIPELVSRARDRNCYSGNGEFKGLTAGSRKSQSVYFRMYDKVIEAEQSGTLERWRDIWGYDGQDVIRIEYELHKKILRQHGVKGMDSLLERMGDLIDYLFGWLRFAEVQDRKDVQRPLLPWWERFVQLVKGLDFSRIGAKREVLPKMPNVERLEDQIKGLVAALEAAKVFTGKKVGLTRAGVVSDVVNLVNDGWVRIEIRSKEKLKGYKLAGFGRGLRYQMA